MEDIHLGGTAKLDPNNANVRRAIESSVRILTGTSANPSSVSESGHLVNLDPAQMQQLGLKPQDQVVLTDAHGVENAHGEIMVQGSNDAWYAARLVKLDDIRDLAYLKVDNLPPGVLPHVDIAKSDDTVPGDLVFGVGHAGADSAISANGTTYMGMSSKRAELNRLGTATGNGDAYAAAYQKVIATLNSQDKADVSVDYNRPLGQTQSVNQKGESGGGLFNAKGELISVVEATETGNNKSIERDLYTPLTQIQAFENEPQKFVFNYGTEAYKFNNSPTTVNIPALTSIKRADGDPRPPMSVATLVESKLQSNNP